MVQQSVAEAQGEGQDRPFVCSTCGKTFKALKGLKGHESGRHGLRSGINATLEGFAGELRGIREALLKLEQATSRGHALEERYVSLAQEKAKRKVQGPGGCDGGYLDTQLDLLQRALKGVK